MKENLTKGVGIIEAALKKMPELPGVYRMTDEDGKPLYIGKARNLSKRVVYYTKIEQLPYRLKRMVFNVSALNIFITTTEVEALLLEAHLIKEQQPRYNIRLKDDKTFPYITLSSDHPYPQVMVYRGKKRASGIYFGPFASAGSARKSLTELQKLFRLRPCSDNYFASRTSPCLQYQLRRCSAPCVGKITESAYKENIEQAHHFLTGSSDYLQQMLSARMDLASDAMRYEEAATIRDRMQALRYVQSQSPEELHGVGDADFIGLYREGGNACVHLWICRGGRIQRGLSFLPSVDKEDNDADIITAFLTQFYISHSPPAMLYVSKALSEKALIEEALSSEAHYTVTIESHAKNDAQFWIEKAVDKAQETLHSYLHKHALWYQGRASLVEIFNLSRIPSRIEIYDNSHIGGTHAVGAMVVAGAEGFTKSSYRRFRMKTITSLGGDDYAYMREMLTRRLKSLIQKNPEYVNGLWPDLLLIDGGPGHLSTVWSVLEELELMSIPVVGIAKGPERNAGREFFYMPGREPFQMPVNHPTLHYLQILRDEAHRFAITTHRNKRIKAISHSILDDISGISAVRKRGLLHYFGSAQAVSEASLDDLMKVKGISQKLAYVIYNALHTK